jgi:basic amino acid/polyamine antiporter, APA family
LSAPGREGPPLRKLGFGMCLALVVGNIIGSGVYLLPASLAPLGANVLTGWLATAGGAITLGVVFTVLSRELRGNGGPYAATRAAFGPLAGFVVAWGYWVSIWVGNVTIATGAVSYTSTLVPWIANVKGAAPLLTVAVVWLFTFVNCFGVRASGWVQSVTTVLKCVPLVAVPLAAFVRFRPEWLSDLAAGPPISLDGTAAAAALTLWAVVGFESATVPADKTEDPARTIPRATLLGTLVSTILCALACSAVMLLVPSRTLASSNAPFADAARLLFGDGAAVAVTLLAAVSAYGALNGWILLQGELPQQMARAGVFPRLFAQTSSRGAPVFALVSTSVLVTALVLMNFGSSMVQVFTFMALLSTTANLVAYLACSLALLALQRRGEIASRKPGWLAATAALGAAFSLWAIAGAGLEPVLWGAVLILGALPVYWLMRRSALPRPEPAQP